MVAYLSWTMSEIDPFIAQKIVGKTYDLTSAYKQFGIHARDREVLRIATWNADEHRVALLGVNALPFGATGSVSSFFADLHCNLVPRGPTPEPGMDRIFRRLHTHIEAGNFKQCELRGRGAFQTLGH